MACAGSAVGEGSALDAAAARVGRDLAPDRAASISRAEPSPTVRRTAHPLLLADSCSAPRAWHVGLLLNRAARGAAALPTAARHAVPLQCQTMLCPPAPPGLGAPAEQLLQASTDSSLRSE